MLSFVLHAFKIFSLTGTDTKFTTPDHLVQTRENLIHFTYISYLSLNKRDLGQVSVRVNL